MKPNIQFLSFLLLLILFTCKEAPSTQNEQNDEQRTKIKMVTDFGTIHIELYNETPKHRDNFTKLANNKTLDSLLFHRVINSFMIQGGDTDSKYAKPGDTLGNGGLDYTVDAEFHPDLFHKKGVLASARDNNPERASSSTQFYIVQGKVQNDSLLKVNQTRINSSLAEYYVKKDSTYKNIADALDNAIQQDNWETYNLYNDSIKSIAQTYSNYKKYTIPKSHRIVYKSIGGTPHLDQNYTVFGEVVKGLEIIDSIAAVKTNNLDRPVKDIRIISVKVL